MPKNYVTKWIKVATEGKTVDGRNVQKNWLDEMAATYDVNEYAARIWVDHWRFFGAMGDVIKLKTATDKKDRLCLFAKITPSDELLKLNKDGKYLYSSIEVAENFAGSGQAYLYGLAVTDQPASIGTQRLEFRERIGKDNIALLNTNCLIHGCDLNEEKEEAADIETDKNEHLSLFRQIKNLLTKKQSFDEEDNSMSTEQFDALTNKIDSLAAVVQKLSDTAEKKDESTGKEEKPVEKPSKDEEIKALTAEIAELQEKFNALDKLIKQEVTPTVIGEHTGATEDKQEYI